MRLKSAERSAAQQRAESKSYKGGLHVVYQRVEDGIPFARKQYDHPNLTGHGSLSILLDFHKRRCYVVLSYNVISKDNPFVKLKKLK